MTSEPHPFLQGLLEAVNAHDVDAVAAHFAEDYVNQTPVHPTRGFTGLAQVRRNWSTIFGAMPDLVADVTASAVDGDEVWSEWTMDGTRPDGVATGMRGVIVFTVTGGAAVAARFYLEPLDRVVSSVDEAVAGATGAGARP